MILKSFQIVLLGVLLALSTTTQSDRSSDSARSEKQRASEEEADRVMHRFYETLDFGDIYREMYVSDILKAKEVRIIMRHIAVQGHGMTQAPNIDFAAMERAYIAKRNFDFLVSAQNFTYDGDKERRDKEAEVEFKRYYMPMVEPANWPILTSEQLDSRFTANINHLNEFLRKYVVSKNYDTTLYKTRIALFKESRPPEEGLVRLFGLSERIYVAQRERLHLYFVEENGKFRMLSATPRVMD